ncbi:hypothetical protein HY029_02600 [Candidatus Gottesmanbacteria bacterium]|nr:hypothetical protein [Candidatus Gottesmanbacteria bacterium]
MHKGASLFLIIGSSFLLGLRHGIDWDHIAAITDITGSFDNKKEGILLGSLYALGHAAVIITLGLAAVLVGISLPGWVDSVMTPIVGVTLILLGVWLISSIIIHGKNYKIKSRWMLVFALINKLYNYVYQKISHKHHHPHIAYPETYGMKGAFTIGLIHGIGAETPTQVLLFISAAGVGGSFIGSILVFTFVIGLFLSNTAIVLASVTGFSETHGQPYARLILGSVAAVFSIAVGILFLTNKVSLLPVFFGG